VAKAIPPDPRKAAAGSERLFQTVFENIVDGVLVADIETKRFHAANPAFCKMLGCSLEEALQLGVQDLHPPESLARVVRAFEKQAARRQSLARDIPVLRRDGSVFYADVNAFPIEFSGRTCLMGVFRDVSARKEAEDLLKESESRFRGVIEQSSEGIVLIDEKGHVIEWNRAQEDGTGKRRDEVLGRPLWQVVCELLPARLRRSSLEEAVRSGIDEACRTGKSCWFDELHELEIVRADGEERFLQILAYPVRVRNGFRLGAGCRDITARRAVEQALRESEEKYRTLVETAGEAIAMVDRRGVVLFMNRMAATNAGGSPDDFIGKSLGQVLPPDVAERHLAEVRAVIDGGQGGSMTGLIPVRGQPRWYSTTIEPVRNAEGSITAALVVGRDIHDLRQARAELEEYREKMARADRLASLGTLSATIAHELTQPLTVSRLSLQEALADVEAGDYPPEVREALHESLGGISDATFRVERFRNFARRSSKEVPTNVQMEEVLSRTVRLLEGKAHEKNMSILVQNLGDFPAIVADEKDMEQMCFALIENAIQAADGRSRHQLVISAERIAGQMCLRFEDDCGGITPEHADRIFQPFFTTKPPNEGTGLGLCIVERIVGQVRGKVRVENAPDRGVAFCVALPLKGP